MEFADLPYLILFALLFSVVAYGLWLPGQIARESRAAHIASAQDFFQALRQQEIARRAEAEFEGMSKVDGDPRIVTPLEIELEKILSSSVSHIRSDDDVVQHSIRQAAELLLGHIAERPDLFPVSRKQT